MSHSYLQIYNTIPEKQPGFLLLEKQQSAKRHSWLWLGRVLLLYTLQNTANVDSKEFYISSS